MEVKVKIEDKDVGRRLKKRADDWAEEIRDVMRETAEEVADFILFAGAEDIQEAGNFGEDWVDALHADIEETQRTFTIDVSMQPQGPPVIYWKVFEYGATIFAHGDNLLTWPNTSGFSIEGKTPAFISKHSVVIPKKFHLHEVVREEAAKLHATFKRLLSERRS